METSSLQDQSVSRTGPSSDFTPSDAANSQPTSEHLLSILNDGVKPPFFEDFKDFFESPEPDVYLFIHRTHDNQEDLKKIKDPRDILIISIPAVFKGTGANLILLTGLLYQEAYIIFADVEKKSDHELEDFQWDRFNELLRKITTLTSKHATETQNLFSSDELAYGVLDALNKNGDINFGRDFLSLLKKSLSSSGWLNILFAALGLGCVGFGVAALKGCGRKAAKKLLGKLPQCSIENLAGKLLNTIVEEFGAEKALEKLIETAAPNFLPIAGKFLTGLGGAVFLYEVINIGIECYKEWNKVKIKEKMLDNASDLFMKLGKLKNLDGLKLTQDLEGDALYPDNSGVIVLAMDNRNCRENEGVFVDFFDTKSNGKLTGFIFSEMNGKDYNSTVDKLKFNQNDIKRFQEFMKLQTFSKEDLTREKIFSEKTREQIKKTAGEACKKVDQMLIGIGEARGRAEGIDIGRAEGIDMGRDMERIKNVRTLIRCKIEENEIKRNSELPEVEVEIIIDFEKRHHSLDEVISNFESQSTEERIRFIYNVLNNPSS